MLRPALTFAASTIIAFASSSVVAQAAPFSAFDIATVKDGSDLIQVQRGGGKGGGYGGFRGGGGSAGPRMGGNVGPRMGGGGPVRVGGGNRVMPRHKILPHRPPVGCKAAWCKPTHGHRHKKRGVTVVIGGGGYGYASGCGYFYRRWQNTGSRYWRSRYYECLDY